MKIILLRHLDTIYSREHRICGQTDCGILPNGKLIIPDEIMEILNTEKIKVYTSPLKRCLETVNHLQEKANFSDTVLVPEFSERDWGPLTGMTKMQVLQQYGMELSSLRNTLSGIETDKDFSTRVYQGIKRTVLTDVFATIIIITHQGCLRILCEFFGAEYKKFQPGEFALIKK